MPRNRAIGFFALGLLLLVLGPIARTFAVQPAALIRPTPLPSFANCTSLRGWSAEWSPTFVAADYSIADSYQCEGYRLHVSLAQYVEQHQGKEAVGEFNSVIPRSWWNVTLRGRQHATPDLEVNEYQVNRTPLRLTIWNWYAVGLRPTSSEMGTKAMEALNALRLRSRATTNITVAVESEPSFDATKALNAEAKQVWSWFVAQMSSPV